MVVRGLRLRAVRGLRRVGDADPQGAAHSTVLMLHVYDGVLRFYSGTAIEAGIYDHWFRLNVVHDLGASTVTVYIDGRRKYDASVIPSGSFLLVDLHQ